MMSEYGEYCAPGFDLTEEKECRIAAATLGLTYGYPWAGPGEHRFCSYANDGRKKVYFNTGALPAPKANDLYASLCWRVEPEGLELKCVPFTKETEVSNAGAWAMAIFPLSGVWIVSLWFVIILFAPAMKVHPTPVDADDDPYGLERFRQQQEDQAKLKRMKKTCKKICKFILKSVETIVGTAIFAVSGIAIVITGGVTLTQAKPECAAEPRYAPSAWAEEPTERVAIVWCEQGYVATIGLFGLAFCCFLLVFSMSFGKVLKYRHEKRMKEAKAKLKKMREKSKEKGEAVEEGRDYGEGFRIEKMIPPEEAPEAIFSDYDGRIFDL